MMTDIATATLSSGKSYVGYIDRVTPAGVTGWIWSPDDPSERVVVSVCEGDRLIGTAVADTFRIDLAPSGVGDGSHAFEFSFLPEHGTIVPDRVRVVVEPAGYAVPRIDLSFKAPVFNELSDRAALIERVVARHHQILGLDNKPYVGMDLVSRLASVETGLSVNTDALKTAELSLLRIDQHIAAADARERIATLEERVRGLTRKLYVTIGAAGGLVIILSIFLAYLVAAL